MDNTTTYTILVLNKTFQVASFKASHKLSVLEPAKYVVWLVVKVW